MKRYYSINLLSLYGVLSAPFWLWTIYRDMQVTQADYIMHTDPAQMVAFRLMWLLCFLLYNSGIFAFFIAFLIEKIIYKKRKIEPKCSHKIQNNIIFKILFYTGFICLLTPHAILALHILLLNNSYF